MPSYMDRAMKSSDRRYRRILDRLGYERSDMSTDGVGAVRSVARDPLDHDGNGRKGGSTKPKADEDLAALRDEYEAVLGKRPFNGWDAATLRSKIAARTGS